MRLVIISDTHGKTYGSFGKYEIPDGDVLIHCGDACIKGTEKELVSFRKWFNSFPHKNKIFCAGNHDFICQDRPKDIIKDIMEPSIYLQDEEIIIDGIKFYGSPWQPEFFNWAFNMPRDELHSIWELIPDDVNVLITHGPPKGIADETRDMIDPTKFVHVGCSALMKEIFSGRLNSLKVHCFGHIHSGYGTYVNNGIKFVNAASCNEKYLPKNSPIIVDI